MTDLYNNSSVVPSYENTISTSGKNDKKENLISSSVDKIRNSPYEELLTKKVRMRTIRGTLVHGKSFS